MIRNSLLNKLRERKNLQVALDFININDAIKVAKQAIEGGAEIIEDGTPLIKSAGIQGLLKLDEIANEKILLADTKTADAGDIEVEIAKRGNAKIMTVLGIMDDSTIESAVNKAKELDILVQADLINVKDTIQRAKELHDIGVDIIGFHVGLDVQKKRNITVASLKEEIKEISKFTIVSVAGGLNASNIKDLLDIPINIYVVGGAITRSNNPYEATKEIVNVINTSYK